MDVSHNPDTIIILHVEESIDKKKKRLYDTCTTKDIPWKLVSLTKGMLGWHKHVLTVQSSLALY